MTGQQMFVQFGEAEQWVVVNRYGDGSAVLGVYGLFGSEEAAEAAITVLADGGVRETLEAMPLRKVVFGPLEALTSARRFEGTNGLLAALIVAEGEAEPQLEEVRLTTEQEDLLALNLKVQLGVGGDPARVSGTPIVTVATVEESTPYRYGWRP